MDSEDCAMWLWGGVVGKLGSKGILDWVLP